MTNKKKDNCSNSKPNSNRPNRKPPHKQKRLMIKDQNLTKKEDIPLSDLEKAVIKEVDFKFFVVSYSGEWQLPGTFFGMKKYYS